MGFPLYFQIRLCQWEGVILEIQFGVIIVFSHFPQLGPLGRVGLVVTKSVCVLFVCLSPSNAIFLRGRTGAEHASFVDWCDLDLNLE